MRENSPLSRARRATRRRRGRGRIFALGCLGLGLIGFPELADPAPRLVWNASASAPIGFYWITGIKDVSRGDLVLAWAPEAARRLAAARGYLPEGVPLVKRVEGVAGDMICASDGTTSVNGRVVAQGLRHDRQGRELPNWTGCQVLRHGEFFPLMEGESDSFDGRYFGPIKGSAIIGRLVPLWIE